MKLLAILILLILCSCAPKVPVEEPRPDDIKDTSHVHEDVNKDNDINVFDLVMVQRAFGASESGREDVNRDGVVNIFDLVSVARGFNAIKVAKVTHHESWLGTYTIKPEVKLIVEGYGENPLLQFEIKNLPGGEWVDLRSIRGNVFTFRPSNNRHFKLRYRLESESIPISAWVETPIYIRR